MSISLTHKNPHLCSLNCLRLLKGQSRAPTLPKLCVMVVKISQKRCIATLGYQNQNLRPRKLAETMNDPVTGIVAIPSVIFFSGYNDTPAKLLNSLKSHLTLHNEEHRKCCESSTLFQRLIHDALTLLTISSGGAYFT